MKHVIKSVYNSLLFALLLFLLSATAYAAPPSVSGSVTTQYKEIYPNSTSEVYLNIVGTNSRDETVPTDVVLIMDTSGSMGQSGKISALKSAVTKFVDTVDLSSHKVGLVSFGSSNKRVQGFTDNKDSLRDFINDSSAMSASGGTTVGPAIEAAATMIDSPDHRQGAKPVIILLTDGQAGDPADMAAKAKLAKSKGYIFYTIAVLANENSAETDPYNISLKALATTTAHHHFVGASQLEKVYDAIAVSVGENTPYNAVITQCIADEFEYVPGSADDNVPIPRFNSSTNTLAWEMPEIRNTQLSLHYSIRPKSGVAYGTYNILKESKVTYSDYINKNNLSEATLNNPTIELKEYIPPTIISINPDNTKQGTEVTSRVTFDKSTLKYEKDFTVFLDGHKVSTKNINDDSFDFVVTKSFSANSYNINILNHSVTDTIGTFTVNPPDGLNVTDFYPREATEGYTKPIVAEATGTGFKHFPDAVVRIGAVEVIPHDKYATYFDFDIPVGLAAGEYDITIYNGGVTSNIGVFIVKPAQPVKYPLNISTYFPKETKEGYTKPITIEVDGSGFKYSPDFVISVNGTDIKPTDKYSKYFLFDIPVGLPAGDYSLVAKNGGTDTNIGIFKVNPTAPAKPMAITGYDPKQKEEGYNSAISIDVTGNSLKYGSDFKVSVGGVDAAIVGKYGSYFSIEVPTGLTAGVYPLPDRGTVLLSWSMSPQTRINT